MGRFSGRQIAVIAIPLLVIVVLLPVALIIGFAQDTTNESQVGHEEADVAAVRAPPPEGEPAIVMRDIRFVPEEISIVQGQTLYFWNQDNSEHTASIEGGEDSGSIPPGQHWGWTARESGVFEFICEVHPGPMQGTITVRPPIGE